MSKFSPKTSGPSAAEIAQRQESARQAERARLEKEQAEKEAKKRAEDEQAFAQKESNRKKFAASLLTAEKEDDTNKRFLKGA